MRKNKEDDGWRLDELHAILLEQIQDEVAAGKISEADIGPTMRKVIDEAVPVAARIWLDELSRRIPRMLREHRAMARGFVRRNIRRWKPGFDALEVLIVAAQEAGEAVNAVQRPTAVANSDYKFEALVGLHGRAVLVAREILWLMQGGFADRALGRWKTLHELAVVASFVQKHDVDVAERYLLHRTVRSAKAAEQYKEYETAAGLKPFDGAELAQLVAAREAICQKHGAEMREDWGWAAKALGKSKRITFFDIEKDVGLDHWRPRYRWASQDTHGNFRPNGSSLGMCEASEEMILVGPSNSGMIDPGQMVAHALVMATMPLLVLEPNFDRLATMRVLEVLRSEVGESFFVAENESLEAHERASTGLRSIAGRLTGRLREVTGLWA